MSREEVYIGVLLFSFSTVNPVFPKGEGNM